MFTIRRAYAGAALALATAVLVSACVSNPSPVPTPSPDPTPTPSSGSDLNENCAQLDPASGSTNAHLLADCCAGQASAYSSGHFESVASDGDTFVVDWTGRGGWPNVAAGNYQVVATNDGLAVESRLVDGVAHVLLDAGWVEAEYQGDGSGSASGIANVNPAQLYAGGDAIRLRIPDCLDWHTSANAQPVNLPDGSTVDAMEFSCQVTSVTDDSDVELEIVVWMTADWVSVGYSVTEPFLGPIPETTVAHFTDLGGDVAVEAPL